MHVLLHSKAPVSMIEGRFSPWVMWKIPTVFGMDMVRRGSGA